MTDRAPVLWPRQLFRLLLSDRSADAVWTALSAHRTPELWVQLVDEYLASHAVPAGVVEAARALGRPELQGLIARLEQGGSTPEVPLEVRVERWLNGADDAELARAVRSDGPARDAYRAVLARRFGVVDRLDLPAWGPPAQARLPHGLVVSFSAPGDQAWGDEVTGPMASTVQVLPAAPLDVALAAVGVAERGPSAELARALASELERGVFRDPLERAHRLFESGGRPARAVDTLQQTSRLAARGQGPAQVIPLRSAARQPQEPDDADLALWTELAFRLRLALEAVADELADQDLERALLAADRALLPFRSGLLLMDPQRPDELDPRDLQDAEAWYGVWRAIGQIPRGNLELALLEDPE